MEVESHLCYLFAASFAVAFVLVPPTARRVRQLGAVVLPGGRSIHGRRTPLLGGFAVFVPFFVTAVVLGILGDPKGYGIAAGALVMLLVGGYDDLKGVRPRTKVLAQVLAALLLYLSGFRLPVLDVPGLRSFPLDSLEIPLMVFWVVLASNAFNLTDGMDGLASSLALVGCIGALALGSWPVLAVVLAGAVLAFLRYNMPRASIFLGDSGSLLLGFALAAFALDAPTTNNVAIAYGLLAYSLGDVALAVSRRALRGKPLFAGDKSHVHHKLRMHLRSTWGALLAAAAFAGLQLTIVFTIPGLPGLALCAGLWAALVLALMAVGRVRVRHMLSSRLPFQRMHLVRNYVLGLLRFAEERVEVENALRHLVDDMGLARSTSGTCTSRTRALCGPSRGPRRARSRRRPVEAPPARGAPWTTSARPSSAS
jgi:UDP-GlcNAc:undecaprenyl-phosphate GlcNAc-1-phosphate transferase